MSANELAKLALKSSGVEDFHDMWLLIQRGVYEEPRGLISCAQCKIWKMTRRDNDAGQSHLWESWASTQQKIQWTTTVYQDLHWNITYFQWRPTLWWGCHAVYVWDKKRAFKGSSLHHNERFQILFGTACKVNRWQASCCLLKFPLRSFCSSSALKTENFLFTSFHQIFFLCLAFVQAHSLNLQHEALNVLQVIRR